MDKSIDELSDSMQNCFIGEKKKKKILPKKRDGFVLLQAIFRGYLCRKKLKKNKDGMTLDLLCMLIEKYNDKLLFNEEINKKLTHKKIRNENFPSEISENLVKFAILKKYGVLGCWDTDRGDLVVLSKKIEIKGFMSDGPSSFGPTESWDWIYFVDAKNTLQKKFKIYEFKMSNSDTLWSHLKMNKKETYLDQCNQKRRPRTTFQEIQKQLHGHYQLIFDGHIDQLLE